MTRTWTRRMLAVWFALMLSIAAFPSWAMAQGVNLPFPTEFAGNLMLLSALLGAVMPALIAVILRRDWTSETKGIAALLICLVAAAALAAAMGQLNPTDYARSALIVFTLCQILYQTYWKPTDIAPAIERATG